MHQVEAFESRYDTGMIRFSLVLLFFLMTFKVYARVSSQSEYWRLYTIKNHEHIWKISRTLLGQPASDKQVKELADKIIKHNKLKHPKLLEPKDYLFVPALRGISSRGPAMGAQFYHQEIKIRNLEARIEELKKENQRVKTKTSITIMPEAGYSFIKSTQTSNSAVAKFPSVVNYSLLVRSQFTFLNREFAVSLRPRSLSYEDNSSVGYQAKNHVLFDLELVYKQKLSPYLEHSFGSGAYEKEYILSNGNNGLSLYLARHLGLHYRVEIGPNKKIKGWRFLVGSKIFYYFNEQIAGVEALASTWGLITFKLEKQSLDSNSWTMQLNYGMGESKTSSVKQEVSTLGLGISVTF